MASTAAPTGIYTPGSIWAKAIEHSKANKQENSREDAHIYFLGAKSSGKTALLNRFLYPNQVEVPKASQCLEYTFARKTASGYGPGDRKDLAHIWEVAGSEAFAQHLCQGTIMSSTIQYYQQQRKVANLAACACPGTNIPPEMLY